MRLEERDRDRAGAGKGAATIYSSIVGEHKIERRKERKRKFIGKERNTVWIWLTNYFS